LIGFTSHAAERTFYTDPDIIETVNSVMVMKDVVVLSRWDYAYFWQYMTLKPTFVDGGSFYRTERDGFVTQVFTANELQAYFLINRLEKEYGKKIVFIIDDKFVNLKPKIEMQTMQEINNSSLFHKLVTNSETQYFNKIHTTKNKKVRIYTAI